MLQTVPRNFLTLNTQTSFAPHKELHVFMRSLYHCPGGGGWQRTARPDQRVSIHRRAML